MKFGNGKKLTVMALILFGYALFTVYAEGNIVLACTALILANLEMEDG